MEFDQLDAFFRWWQAHNVYKPPREGPVMQHNDCSTSTVVYRSGQFQVQQVVLKPNSEIPDHIHPNVDSIELYGAGDIVFRRNDEKPFVGVNSGIDCLRILPTDWHGGTFGPRGGVFFSVQHWLKGSPDFIIDDWKPRDPNERRKNYERDI
jgi:hypothetical protein